MYWSWLNPEVRHVCIFDIGYGCFSPAFQQMHFSIFIFLPELNEFIILPEFLTILADHRNPNDFMRWNNKDSINFKSVLRPDHSEGNWWYVAIQTKETIPGTFDVKVFATFGDPEQIFLGGGGTTEFDTDCTFTSKYGGIPGYLFLVGTIRDLVLPLYLDNMFFWFFKDYCVCCILKSKLYASLTCRKESQHRG